MSYRACGVGTGPSGRADRAAGCSGRSRPFALDLSAS